MGIIPMTNLNEDVILIGSDEKQRDEPLIAPVKKHSRQESVVDSESIPDIETFDDKENKFVSQENKDLVSNDDDLELDEDFEAYKKERRKSSYEETLAGMDPDLLKELGLAQVDDESGKSSDEKLDLSLLPTETAEERLNRIEEKASKMVIEDDPIARKSRSRPPSLDTVMEQKKEEILEARFYGLQPSLDTIKESPSTASMLGVLQGGVSSASVNTVLQGSASNTEVNKSMIEQIHPMAMHKEMAIKSKESIAEEKENDSADQELGINNSEGKQKDVEKSTDTKGEEPKQLDVSKKPKKKAKRSDTKLIQSTHTKSEYEDTTPIMETLELEQEDLEEKDMNKFLEEQTGLEVKKVIT